MWDGVNNVKPSVACDEGALGVGLSLGKVAGLFSSIKASCITIFRFTAISKGISAEHRLKYDLFPCPCKTIAIIRP